MQLYYRYYMYAFMKQKNVLIVLLAFPELFELRTKSYDTVAFIFRI